MALFATYTPGPRLLQITWDRDVQAIGSPVNSQVRVVDGAFNIRPASGGHSISGPVQSATMSPVVNMASPPPRASYSGSWIHSLGGTPALPDGDIPLISF